MAGILDFGQTEEEKKQNLGLLGLLVGGNILANNQGGATTGQAIGAGLSAGAQGAAQMQQQAGINQMRQLQMEQLRRGMNAPIKVGDALVDPRTYKPVYEAPNAGVAKNTPANVLEWQYYSQLPPEEQARYLTMKRANPYVNLGGSMMLPNPAVPGDALANVPKSLPPEALPETRAAQTVAVKQAENQVQAEADLPSVIAKAEQSIKLVDDLIAHPGLKGMVGAPESVSGVANMIFGAPIPGTQEANFKAILDQIGGQQFLQAFETLKGGGQITQIEGEKATRAISRLTQTGQTEEAYKKAAQEFKEVVQAGIDRARKKAGMSPAQPQQAQPAPQNVIRYDAQGRRIQ